MSVLPAVRSVVRDMDSDQPIYAIQTVDEAFASATATRRATTTFLSIFAVFALILAAVGIYAVVSFTVSERTQEIGLRVALGADARGVRRPRGAPGPPPRPGRGRRRARAGRPPWAAP